MYGALVEVVGWLWFSAASLLWSVPKPWIAMFWGLLGDVDGGSLQNPPCVVVILGATGCGPVGGGDGVEMAAIEVVVGGFTDLLVVAADLFTVADEV